MLRSMRSKQAISQRFLEARAEWIALHRHEIDQYDQHLIDFIEERKFKKIALYLADDCEPPTRRLMEYAWQAGLKVYAPVIHQADHTMDFFLIDQHSVLQPGPFAKITQPTPQGEPEDNFDVILVPLVAFTESGDRLGRGGGYYDLFLARYEISSPNRPQFVGLGFEVQKTELIPMQDHDISMDWILTELAVYGAGWPPRSTRAA